MRIDRFCVLLCTLVLTGCALRDLPPREEIAKQAAPNLTPPAQWAAAEGRAGAVSDNWFMSWNDPALEALIGEALAYNADLRMAAARVDLAASYVRAIGSPLWPQVNLIARGGGQMGGDASGLEGIGLFATWEIDVWARVRSEKAAAEMQYESARLDAEYARQSIAAMVAKAWLLAVEARLAKALTEETLVAAEQLATLADNRLRVGVGDEYDVALARANAESFRDTARNLDLSYRNALRALEALIGRYPLAAVTVSSALPQWPGDVPVGLPSELLERRPDFVAAERRVAAAFYRIEGAKAARLPRFALVASYTTLSSEMFVLQERDNPLFSIGANLVQPLFLGGYLKSQVDARTAEQQAAIADYGRVTAKAFGEVEGALSAEFAAAAREEILRRSERENARALAFANVRYRVGSGDRRGVEQQQLALYTSQIALLRMQTERLVQRVNLHLALGGGFGSPDSAPIKTGSATGVRP